MTRDSKLNANAQVWHLLLAATAPLIVMITMIWSASAWKASIEARMETIATYGTKHDSEQDEQVKAIFKQVQETHDAVLRIEERLKSK